MRACLVFLIYACLFFYGYVDHLDLHVLTHSFPTLRSADLGYIKGLGQDVRLTDRFFLGEPQIRGFGIRGVGPRVIRRYLDDTTGRNETDDALGGKAYYLGRAELEIPLGAGAREMGQIGRAHV